MKEPEGALHRETREDLSQEQSQEQREGGSQAGSWRKSAPGTWRSRCKGPGVGMSEAYTWKRTDAVRRLTHSTHGKTQGVLMWHEVREKVERGFRIKGTWTSSGGHRASKRSSRIQVTLTFLPLTAMGRLEKTAPRRGAGRTGWRPGPSHPEGLLALSRSRGAGILTFNSLSSFLPQGFSPGAPSPCSKLKETLPFSSFL